MLTKKMNLAAVVAGITILAAVLAVYGRAVFFKLAGQDDGINIGLNPHLCSADGLLFLWTHAYDHLFIPVTYSLWSFLCVAAYPIRSVVPPDAVFHGANVLVHALNGILVFLLLRDVLARARPKAADSFPAAELLGALVFVCHPIQVEAVAWATGMKDLLSATFALAALRAWLRLRDRRPAPPKARALLWPTALFAAACLAKPSAIALPAAAAALEWGLGSRQWKLAARELVGWFAVALLAALITILAHYGDDATVFAAPWWLRLPEATGNFATYLGALFLFVSLTMRQPQPLDEYLMQPEFWILAAIGAAILGLLWLGRRRFPLAVTGALVFLAGLACVLGFIPFRYQEVFSDTSDRFAYFAMAGAALAAAAFVHAARDFKGWPALTRLAPVFAGLALVVMGATAASRATIWRDGISYVERTGRGVTNKSSYGLALLDAGRFDEGLAQLRAALAERPADFNRWQRLIAGQAIAGRDEDMIRLCRDTIALDRRHAFAHYALGQLLALNGHADEAVSELETAKKLATEISGWEFPPAEYLAIVYPRKFPLARATMPVVAKRVAGLPILGRLAEVIDIEAKWPGRLPKPNLRLEPK